MDLQKTVQAIHCFQGLIITSKDQDPWNVKQLIIEFQLDYTQIIRIVLQSFPDIRILSLREIQIVLKQSNYEENFQRKIFNICRLQSERF